MGQQQHEPRDDQLRDKDVIRRYEMGSDIDGTLVGIHVDGNVLSLHEPVDKECTKPKFVLVFRDGEDLRHFAHRLADIADHQCPWCLQRIEQGQTWSAEKGIHYHASCLTAQHAEAKHAAR